MGGLQTFFRCSLLLSDLLLALTHLNVGLRLICNLLGVLGLSGSDLEDFAFLLTLGKICLLLEIGEGDESDTPGTALL